MKKLTISLTLAVGLLFVVLQLASAHAFIDHCTPEVGSTIPQAPSELRCTFTDPIDPKQTTLAVFDASNHQVDNKDLKGDPNDPNGTTVLETLNSAQMSGGLYTVKWSTVAEDGHATDGQFQFAVTGSSSATAPTVAPTAVPSTANAATPVATLNPTTAAGAVQAPASAPLAAPAAPAAVTILSPTEDTKFPNVPADVTVNIQVSNFPLGQEGHKWIVYLDNKLVQQVTDASTTVTLHAVPAGDYALKVALATSDNTVVATGGTGLGVGPGPGDIPSTAIATTCNWQPLIAGSDIWYQIPYIAGNQLEITLDNKGTNVGFDVWDSQRIQTWGTPNQTAPIGSGTANPNEPGHDLTWSGHLPSNGSYWVHVTNNDTADHAYNLCSSQH
jgi:methionine-rich copper-binding protein CopC